MFSRRCLMAFMIGWVCADLVAGGFNIAQVQQYIQLPACTTQSIECVILNMIVRNQGSR